MLQLLNFLANILHRLIDDVNSLICFSFLHDLSYIPTEYLMGMLLYDVSRNTTRNK
jgi:hypothetical protein